MKYIMLKTEDGAHMPVIFPEALTHSIVAGAIQMALYTLDPKNDLMIRRLESMAKDGPAEVASAGFVTVNDAWAFGRSESLGIEISRGDAARMILGEAIQYMPGEMAITLLEEFKAERAAKQQ